jgi:hypothetical protein
MLVLFFLLHSLVVRNVSRIAHVCLEFFSASFKGCPWSVMKTPDWLLHSLMVR